MSTASYIGRVGGLAVALGVGTAIVTGQGVAYATPSTGGEDSQNTQDAEGQGGTTAVKDTDTRGPGKIDLKFPASPMSSDAIGPMTRRPAPSRPHRSSSACPTRRSESPTRSRTQPAQSIRRQQRRAHASRSGGSSSLADRIAAGTGGVTAPAPPDNSAAIQTNNVVANQFANPVAAAKDWMASPRALAGRAVDTPTVPRLSTLWTPPRILAPLGTMKAVAGYLADHWQYQSVDDSAQRLQSVGRQFADSARGGHAPRIRNGRGGTSRDRCRLVRVSAATGADDGLAHICAGPLPGARRHHRHKRRNADRAHLPRRKSTERRR